ncbi:hypothetical protein GCM10009557_65270 [Virgisporangium ochraceum]
MTTRLEGAVRAALDDLTGVAPPPDLAQGAIRRAGRQRVARLSVTAVAVVAAVAAGVPLVVGGTGPTAGPAQGPAEKPFVVTAYSGIIRSGDPGPADDVSLLLDPATGRYGEVPYNEVVPAPDGDPVLVHRGDNSVAHPSRWGLLDRATGEVRWLDLPAPGYTTHGTWSPDGRQLLFTVRPRGSGGGFVVVDAESLSTRPVALPDDRIHNAAGAGFGWTPGGAGVMLVRSAGGGSTHVDRYDLQGRETGTAEVPGGPAGTGVVSPDGTRIALDPVEPGRCRVVDLTTRIAVLPRGLPDAGRVLGWYDNTHLMVREGGAIRLTGELRRTVPLLPEGARAQEVRVGSSAGLTGDAGKLAF